MSGTLLRDRPATSAAMLAVFDDAATLRAALAFEAALAQAQAELGLIDAEAARAIGGACATLVIDPASLAEEVALAGTLAIPLVARLRAAMPAGFAACVHRGATSQDLADTVLMGQVKTATSLLLGDLGRINVALRQLAKLHAARPAVGRTLLQDALPIGFGLRIAQWHAGVADASARLKRETAVQAKIQFGGPAGARAGLAECGQALAARLAGALGLADSAPWHARRGGIAAMAAALGIVLGALGKMARDISLLAQNGIAEARESAVPGRGGSSAMAHKRNPTGCQVTLAAAIRAPGLVASVLAGMPQEEERGLGGWQAEGPVLTELFLLAAGAAEAMAVVAEGLEVDTAAIARNLTAAGLGTDIGESVALVDDILESDGRKN